MAARAAGGGAARTGASATRAAAQEFEAFVLQSFIETMLPRNAEGVFGRGIAGELWKSMLAGEIAKELARSGGIGIADMVAADDAGHSGGL